MKTEKEKMLAGELYAAGAPEIQADQAATRAWLARYNANQDMAATVRHALLLERFAAVGEGVASGRRSIATTASTSAWAMACS